MKTRLVLAMCMLLPAIAAAQDKMSDQLAKAIVLEEDNQNLDKAIQAYQNILAQFDEDRKTAAAAQFHLADCYRKQGKKNEAIAAYRRVVQDFPDQAKLADASRGYLSKTYGISTASTAAEADRDKVIAQRAKAMTQTDQEKVIAQQKIAEARQRYRQTLEQEIQLVQLRISSIEKQIEMGLANPSAVWDARRDLLELQRTLAAFDAGALPIPESKIK